MENTIMNVEVFPLFVRENIHTSKVSVQKRDGGIFITPIKEETEQQPKKVRYGLGCMKGKMSEAADHDWFEPMEDFKDYM